VRRSRVADACVLAGGALLLASAFLPWVRHGFGRSLHGHALVDAVIALGNNDVPGLSSARLTVAWYLVPACGALVWIALGLFGRRSLVARLLASVTLVIVVVVDLVFGRTVGFGDLGVGPVVALGGALLVLVPTFVAVR
jgi:hypothetical protein